MATTDDIFGYHTFAFGAASIRVRRMLTKNQQRQIDSARKALNAAVKEYRDWEAVEGNDPLSEVGAAYVATVIDRQTDEYRRALKAFLADDGADLDLEEWNTQAVRLVYNAVAGFSETILASELAEAFPQIGQPNAS